MISYEKIKKNMNPNISFNKIHSDVTSQNIVYTTPKSTGASGKYNTYGASKSAAASTTAKTTAASTSSTSKISSGSSSGGSSSSPTVYTFTPEYGGPVISTTSTTARVLTSSGLQPISQVATGIKSSTGGSGTTLKTGGYLSSGSSVRQGGAGIAGAIKYPVTETSSTSYIPKADTTSTLIRDTSKINQKNIGVTAKDIFDYERSKNIPIDIPQITETSSVGTTSLMQQMSTLPQLGATLSPTKTLIKQPVSKNMLDLFKGGTTNLQSELGLSKKIPTVEQPLNVYNNKLGLTTTGAQSINLNVTPQEIIGNLQKEGKLKDILNIQQPTGVSSQPLKEVIKTYAPPKDLAQIEREISNIQLEQGYGEGVIKGTPIQKFVYSTTTGIKKFFNPQTKQKMLQADIELRGAEEQKQYNLAMAKIKDSTMPLQQNINILNTDFQNFEARNTALVEKSKTIDLYDDIAVYKFNKEIEGLETEYSKLKEREQLLNEQANKSEEQILNLQKPYQEKILTLQKLSETVKEQDPFYKRQKEDYRALEELHKSDVSLAAKIAGTGAYGIGRVGEGTLSFFRNIGEFAVAAPIRAATESGKRARATGKSEFLTSVIPGLQQARGIYDWQNPELANYKFGTGLNTRALTGAIELGTLGVGTMAGTAVKTVAPSLKVASILGTGLKVAGTVGMGGLIFGPGIASGIGQVKAGESQLSEINTALEQLEINKEQYSDKMYSQQKQFLKQQKGLVESSRKRGGEVVGDVLQTGGEIATLGLSTLQAVKFGRHLATGNVHTPKTEAKGPIDIKIQNERFAGTKGGSFSKTQKGIGDIRESVNVEKLLPQESLKTGQSATASYTEKTTQGLSNTQLKAYTTNTPGQYKLIKTQEFGEKNWGNIFGTAKGSKLTGKSFVGNRVDVVTQLPGQNIATRQIFVNDKLVKTIKELGIQDMGLLGAIETKFSDMIREKPIQISKTQIMQSGKQEGTTYIDNVLKQNPYQKAVGDIGIETKSAQYSERPLSSITKTRTNVQDGKFYNTLISETTGTGKLKVGLSSKNIKPSLTTSTKDIYTQSPYYDLDVGRYEPFAKGFITTTTKFPGVTSVKASTITGRGTYNIVSSTGGKSWDLRNLAAKMGTLPSFGGKKGEAILLFGQQPAIGTNLATFDTTGKILTTKKPTDTSIIQSSLITTKKPGQTYTGTSVVGKITGKTNIDTGLISSVIGGTRNIALPSFSTLGAITSLGAVSTSLLSTTSPITRTAPVARTESLSKMSVLPKLTPVSELNALTKVSQIVSPLTTPQKVAQPSNSAYLNTLIGPAIGITGLTALGAWKMPTFGGFGGGLLQGERRPRSETGSYSWLVTNKIAPYSEDWWAKQKSKNIKSLIKTTDNGFLKEINMKGKF